MGVGFPHAWKGDKGERMMADIGDRSDYVRAADERWECGFGVYLGLDDSAYG